MILVPIPQDHLRGTAHEWLPFVEKIAQRTRCPVDQLVTEALTGLVHLVLIWDAQEKKAYALIGLRVMMRGEDRIAEWIWMSGRGRERWQSLLPDLERYVKEHMGCVAIRAIARKGWSKVLTGYRLTHVVLEREFDG